MKDLLRLEFRKLKRSKSFYIILAIMLAMTVISMITTKLFESFADELNEMGAEFGESFSTAGENVLLGFLSASNFSLLTAIFVSIAVCDDYDNHIVKNIFSRGYSRSDFYFAKLVYLIVTTSIMFVAAATVSAILSEVLFGINGDAAKIAHIISTQYLASLASVSLFFAICTLIKKLGGSIAATIILPSVIALLLALVDEILGVESFSIAGYWVSSIAGSLSTITVKTPDIILYAALSVVYFAVFTVVGYVFNERTEV
ncbi:MAG: ABC transporter permease [Clostridia bacterium]|nr:ABC transporter permease [Clostridia bacterium]